MTFMNMMLIPNPVKVWLDFTLKFSIEHLFNMLGQLPLRLSDLSPRVNQNFSKVIEDMNMKWLLLARFLPGLMRS